MVLFMSHIWRIVQIAKTSLRCVCERLRRISDGCDGLATYAMTWRRFCDDFCRTKSITCLKLWRTVRDEFPMHARTLEYHANVSRRFGESIRKPIANSSHPSEIMEIGALLIYNFQFNSNIRQIVEHALVGIKISFFFKYILGNRCFFRQFVKGFSIFATSQKLSIFVCAPNLTTNQ